MSGNKGQVLCKFLSNRIQFICIVLEKLMQFKTDMLYRTGSTVQEYVLSTADLTKLGTYTCKVKVSTVDSEFSENKIISGQFFF